jgi:prepilin-type N-terminal cleavage/methylation domain-containing protein
MAMRKLVMHRNASLSTGIRDERRWCAFTLTELLVVLAIGAVLLMVLFQPDQSALTRRQI